MGALADRYSFVGLGVAALSAAWTRREIVAIKLRAKWDKRVLFGWRGWSLIHPLVGRLLSWL